MKIQDLWKNFCSEFHTGENRFKYLINFSEEELQTYSNLTLLNAKVNENKEAGLISVEFLFIRKIGERTRKISFPLFEFEEKLDLDVKAEMRADDCYEIGELFNLINKDGEEVPEKYTLGEDEFEKLEKLCNKYWEIFLDFVKKYIHFMNIEVPENAVISRWDIP